jgi:ribosomal-protein-serine acetyltransferase
MASNAGNRPVAPLQADAQTQLRLVDPCHARELHQLIETNRDYLRRWHPWVDILRLPRDVEKAIIVWQLLHAEQRGMFFGVWFRDRLCGMLNHQTLDRENRWSALSFWLDAAHQGQGIMTSGCRTLVTHAFDTLKLNRITIECATENQRSRAIPERLGFRLEGIIRGIEMLHGRAVDHAMYGVLRSEWNERPASIPHHLPAPFPIATSARSSAAVASQPF